MEKWFNVEFESSSGKTEQFKSFVKDLKKFVKKELGFSELVQFSVGHFEVTCFLKIREQLWYLSIGDVRNSNWATKVMYRTAKHERDYTGGYNRWSTMRRIAEDLKTANGGF